MKSPAFDLAALAEEGRRRVLIEGVAPAVDDGRYAVKRTVGDAVTASCDLISDGHDALAGVLIVTKAGGKSQRIPLAPLPNDRFAATFVVEEIGEYAFWFEAWVDAFTTWRRGFEKKRVAGVSGAELGVELLIGAKHLEAAASRATGEAKGALERSAVLVGNPKAEEADRIAIALSPEIAALAAPHPDPTTMTVSDKAFGIMVDPDLARFSAWYELFPRSWGPHGKHGTFKDVEEKLDYVANMGFDILYFPPIHPIGRSFRKGPNNTLTAGPNDPGSPWAVGGREGGHKAVHPELGTLEDFRHLVATAKQKGLQIALDIAFQASPDHPYVKEHPEWFVRRPDGTIQYAENPPKKYQDVYPFDFECEDWKGLWDELKSVFFHWIEQGVTVFRVDNPHTKALRFWEWCIGEVKAKHPETIFLAEAFTRPKLMYALAKGGFSQSYTYFTWRHTKAEFTQYLTEILRPPVAEFYRPNFWPNTPDILPEHLQFGGTPTFLQRLVLAATLSPNYGIYGPAFELLEHVARKGSEEYVDNEKFQLRSWDLEDPKSLADFIARVNRIRRENPALHDLRSLAFHPTDNDQILAYSKRTADKGDVILVVVNLDVHHKHAGFIDLELAELGVLAGETFQVHDLLSEARYQWQAGKNYVELDPAVLPAHIFRIRRRVRSEHDFEYFL